MGPVLFVAGVFTVFRGIPLGVMRLGPLDRKPLFVV